ncbi:DUF5330 domain-containing protein [Hansschlegelia plantiphila]|uniref:DUF5330 domain-containing protein n=1 Tax=Hansschlegelia plantiphila TaxID=374655 RepID=A0A9W6IZ10_9HYPH|nr:DUF5330 domain-containing protein [Hansschlegelia plantiphila]GLK66693.1 hypothetical protein GCM10008179_03310 [Hansschlegelia plantiphila]
MFFLLRTAFWVSVLLLVLPLGGGRGEGPSVDEKASIDAMSALAAAGATVSDVSGFCSRQPDACAVGGEALKLVGERAGAAGSMLQGYLASKPETAKAKQVSTTAAPSGRDTLNASDRKPAWRGPGRQA